ncbi:hypothetical protein SAMN02787081_00303 [Lysinibacillus fusiformis]|uniref:Uncharacterized protein n=1 Tax=Lysinibacillus fusiformis TaxID=28031 RepID=A0A1H9AAW6_9BACI|nr:hypothetical protein SAMN02787081_00303 [Lysinibacillus fusiformis]SEM81247.1 hypothetical protein SAMN02787103_00303 [Lysinibacillus fusiformis]SEP73745.1 hypothetical protein SAMN02787113_00455 [Lysinibacillus fusiformis]
MKRFIKSILSLFPVPFLFHFYEFNCHLARQQADFLFQVFLVFIIVVGISSRNIKLPLFIGLNFIMTVISLIFGYFFIDDDGGWFKPFGRDAAIVFVSIIYILGQLIIRLFSRLVHTNSRSNK